jgi:hypothetical protein
MFKGETIVQTTIKWLSAEMLNDYACLSANDSAVENGDG